MSNTLIVGLLTLLLFYIINRFRSLRNPKLNEPPLVPYKYPIIHHTWDYASDPINFLSKCRKEYGEIFTISVNGFVTTIVGKEFSHEIFNSKNASFKMGSEDRTPIRGILGLSLDSNIVPELSKIAIVSQMHLFIDKIQQSFQNDIDKLIGECKEPKVIENVYQTILTLTSKAAATVFVGDKLCQDKELIALLRNVSNELHKGLQTPGYFGYIHPWFYRQSIIMRFKYGDNAVKKMQKILIEKVKPVVEERVKQEREYGDAWKRPVDCIQFLLDCPGVDKENIDYNWLSGVLFATTFASTATTNLSATNLLLDYGARPEYWNDLIEEQEKINPNNDILNLNQISKMEKLDSFLKESLRLVGHELAVFHKIVDEDFTFSNGYQIPKGREVGIYLKDVHHDNENYAPDANEFDGYRYLGKDSSASEVSRKYLIFGLGRHACPGRQFAVNVIKILFSILVKKYKITTKSGKRPPNIVIGGVGFPYPEPLVFEKRL